MHSLPSRRRLPQPNFFRFKCYRLSPLPVPRVPTSVPAPALPTFHLPIHASPAVPASTRTLAPAAARRTVRQAGPRLGRTTLSQSADGRSVSGSLASPVPSTPCGPCVRRSSVRASTRPARPSQNQTLAESRRSLHRPRVLLRLCSRFHNDSMKPGTVAEAKPWLAPSCCSSIRAMSFILEDASANQSPEPETITDRVF